MFSCSNIKLVVNIPKMAEAIYLSWTELEHGLKVEFEMTDSKVAENGIRASSIMVGGIVANLQAYTFFAATFLKISWCTRPVKCFYRPVIVPKAPLCSKASTAFSSDWVRLIAELVFQNSGSYFARLTASKSSWFSEAGA